MICIMCNAETEIETHDCPAKPKFTPGPWQIPLYSWFGEIMGDGGRQRVAVIEAKYDLAEKVANACLILAAPLLYAKLEELVHKVDLDEARSIIKLLAQARGQE